MEGGKIGLKNWETSLKIVKKKSARLYAFKIGISREMFIQPHNFWS